METATQHQPYDAICLKQSGIDDNRPQAWASTEEIANRIDRWQMQYADNPLVKRIDYRIGFDWSDNPAVFVDVMVARDEMTVAELQRLAENIRADLLRLVRSDEIGLHSYLNFVN
jgi:hypothetical protein